MDNIELSIKKFVFPHKNFTLYNLKGLQIIERTKN